MSAVSDVLRRANGNRLHFWCPGCDMCHGLAFGDGPGPRWEWNGDVDRPTFKPSVLVRRDYGDGHKEQVCHSFITDGQIQFLADSTHALAGKTVHLPHWPGYEAGDS